MGKVYRHPRTRLVLLREKGICLMARPKKHAAPTPRPSPYAAGPITVLRPDANGRLVKVCTLQPGDTEAARQFNATFTKKGHDLCAAR